MCVCFVVAVCLFFLGGLGGRGRGEGGEEVGEVGQETGAIENV